MTRTPAPYGGVMRESSMAAKTLTVTLSACASLALSACMVGPDFVRPKSTVAAALDWRTAGCGAGGGGYGGLVEAVRRSNAQQPHRHGISQQSVVTNRRRPHPAGAGTIERRDRRTVSADAGPRRGGAVPAPEPGDPPRAGSGSDPQDEPVWPERELGAGLLGQVPARDRVGSGGHAGLGGCL